MDEIQNISERREPRKVFSRIGVAYFAILAISILLQYVGMGLAMHYKPELVDTNWFEMLLSFAPLYIVAVPVGYLILRKIPAQKPQQEKMGFGQFIVFLIMCFSIMYIGNIISTLLNSAFASMKGTEYDNPIYGILNNSNIFLNIVFVVLLAPIFEELIFRRLLIDRIRQYGEGTAILVSGLMFGLFHGNLYQFFYAFGLGAMFAYIYLRTGRVRYTIFLHVIINFFGGILSTLIVEGVDLEALSNMDTTNIEEVARFAEENLTQMVGFGLYIIAIIALFIAGLILLIVKRKDAVLRPTDMQLEKGTLFRTVFLNAGMFLFILLTLGLMTYTVFAI